MTKHSAVPGSGWNKAAGISLVVIGVLHLVVMAPHPYWSSWFSGGLWNGAGSPASTSAFWAMPASFAVPMVLLGVMIIRLAPRGEVPAFLGWVLLAWDLICILLISPLSGFSLGLIPMILLVVASLRSRVSARASTDRAELAEPHLGNQS